MSLVAAIWSSLPAIDRQDRLAAKHLAWPKMQPDADHFPSIRQCTFRVNLNLDSAVRLVPFGFFFPQKKHIAERVGVRGGRAHSVSNSSTIAPKTASTCISPAAAA